MAAASSTACAASAAALLARLVGSAVASYENSITSKSQRGPPPSDSRRRAPCPGSCCRRYSLALLALAEPLMVLAAWSTARRRPFSSGHVGWLSSESGKRLQHDAQKGQPMRRVTWQHDRGTPSISEHVLRRRHIRGDA